MDILREILFYPERCSIEDGKVKIFNSEIDKDELIEIDTVDKIYTVEQIVSYITSINVPYTEYLHKCKSNNIKQVSYTDRMKLIDAIRNFGGVPFDGKFIHKREMKYPEISRILAPGKQFKVIIPTNVRSLIALDNVEMFMTRGVFRRANADIEKKEECITFNNIDKFTVVKDAPREWQKVVAVFLDGSNWQYRDWKYNTVAEISKNAATFFLFEDDRKKDKYKEYDVMPIKVVDGSRIDDQTFSLMWEKIRMKSKYTCC